MNRTDRLYALVEELRAVAPRPRSAHWLARRFEVSVRTIERDLDALRESGVPLYAKAGRSGGYAIDRSRTLPPLALRQSAGSPFAAAAASAALKVLATLPTDVRAREQALASSLYEAGDDGPGPAAAGIDATVMAAVERQRVLGLGYVDRSGQCTERDVKPLGLLHSPHGWYLIAHCRLRGAVRGFRLGNMTAAALRDERAPARDPAELRRELDRFDARAFLRT